MTPPRVLFLCSGNYYRSRFAEELFNALAEERALPWRADSRALVEHLEALVDNVGPISSHVLSGLRDRGYRPRHHERYPCAVTAAAFPGFARIVAMDDSEHRPMIEGRFTEHAGRVEYWNVPDTGALDPERALAALEDGVRTLIEECAGDHGLRAPVRAIVE